MPVRDLVMVRIGPPATILGGIVFSLPTASSCTANVTGFIIRVPADGLEDILTRYGRHSLDVCRYRLGGGWTAGAFCFAFFTPGLRRGSYAVCITATQYVNGRPSRHIACRTFRK